MVLVTLLAACTTKTGPIIEPDSQPEAYAMASPTTGEAPLEVQFTASASGGDGALTFAWRFGDGDMSTEKNPLRTFTAAGRYQIVLTVTDADGDTAADVVTIEVTSSVPEGQRPMPVAAILAGACAVPGQTTVQFDASGSTHPLGLGLTFDWSLIRAPVGSTAQLSNNTLENPTFVPDLPGAYDVRVFASDGMTRVASEPLTIRASGLASLEAHEGAGQVAPAEQPFADVVSVVARNDCGEVVTGVPVAWRGENAVPVQSTGETDVHGGARVQVRAGTVVGAATIISEAALAPAITATVALSVSAGPPAFLLLDPPAPAMASASVPMQVVLRTSDRFGNADPAGEVSFDIGVSGDARFGGTNGARTLYNQTTTDGVATFELYDTAAETVSIAVANPVPGSVLTGSRRDVFVEDFESSTLGVLPSGFLEDGSGRSEWRVFEPTSHRPPVGTRVLGTEAGYESTGGWAANGSLVFAMDLTGLRGGADAYLEVRHRYDIYQASGGPSTDGGSGGSDSFGRSPPCGALGVVTTGCPWCATLVPEGGYPPSRSCNLTFPSEVGFAGDSNGWVTSRFDVTALVGGTQSIFFNLWRDGVPQRADGWWIDEIRVVGLVSPVDATFVGGPVTGVTIVPSGTGVPCDGAVVDIGAVDQFGNPAGAGASVALSLDGAATFRASGAATHTVVLDDAGSARIIVENPTETAPNLTATLGQAQSSAAVPFGPPLNAELCDDGLDNDCAGGVDDGCAITYDAESGPEGWVHVADPPAWCHADGWSITNLSAASGQHSWWSGPGQFCEGSASLISPEFTLIGAQPVLRFLHRYDFDDCTFSGNVGDGARVEISADRAAFVPIQPIGGYPGVIQRSCGNPLEGASAFVGSPMMSGFAQVEFDLSAWSGHAVRFRMRAAGDCDLCARPQGWHIDDIVVPGALTGEDPYDGGVSQRPDWYNPDGGWRWDTLPSSGDASGPWLGDASAGD